MHLAFTAPIVVGLANGGFEGRPGELEEAAPVGGATI
jgi:ABC-type glycerol-3-phosphate transport system permease component